MGNGNGNGKGPGSGYGSGYSNGYGHGFESINGEYGRQRPRIMHINMPPQVRAVSDVENFRGGGGGGGGDGGMSQGRRRGMSSPEEGGLFEWKG
jgi:hypothetical protein